MGRIEKICSYLYACEKLADVGCDHGYCTKYALEHCICKSAQISDISAKSLAKAERLLSKYIKSGVVESVVCDGLKKIDDRVDQALIAGMGGLEIIKIFEESFIPKKFVLQPMNNVAAVRKYLLEKNCNIVADDLFEDGKFYFIIKGERDGLQRGGKAYGEAELFFGRDAIKNPLFIRFAKSELAKKKSYINGYEGSSAEKIRKEIFILEELLK